MIRAVLLGDEGADLQSLRVFQLNYGAFERLGNSNSPFQANMESYGASGQVDWDFGAATLTSITAYRWWDWYPKNDVDGLGVSVNTKGQVFLQNSEVQLEELVPKLKAITEARGGNEERIYVRGDRSVDYGTVMRVMGRLSAAGFRRVALVTEVEQGS